MCDGEDTVIFVTSGRQGWIGDTLYLARSVHFEGTFTPADGEMATRDGQANWLSERCG